MPSSRNGLDPSPARCVAEPGQRVGAGLRVLLQATVVARLGSSSAAVDVEASGTASARGCSDRSRRSSLAIWPKCVIQAVSSGVYGRKKSKHDLAGLHRRRSSSGTRYAPSSSASGWSAKQVRQVVVVAALAHQQAQVIQRRLGVVEQRLQLAEHRRQAVPSFSPIGV